jgi:hypothetical protein
MNSTAVLDFARPAMFDNLIGPAESSRGTLLLRFFLFLWSEGRGEVERIHTETQDVGTF